MKCFLTLSLLLVGALAHAQVETPVSDLNRDGVVDVNDLTILLSEWHIDVRQPSATMTVPLDNLPASALPLELVRIPAGTFEMGSDDPVWSRSQEGPVHTVNIAYDFWMSRTGITQAQYLAVMGDWPGNDPYPAFGLGDDYPAYNLSWEDAKNFVQEMTNSLNGVYRLPSESEWEYACRAETTTEFYFGDSLACATQCVDCEAGVLPGNRSDYMWFCGIDDLTGPSVVGLKLPNAFGLHDMHGNLLEFTEDLWHSSYSQGGRPDDGSAWVSGGATPNRIIRGGSWVNSAIQARSAYRSATPPTSRSAYTTIRLVREID